MELSAPRVDASARELAARLQQAAASPRRAGPVEAALEHLLREARRFLRCQAGAVHLVEGAQVTLVAAQNDVIAASALATRKGEKGLLDGGSVAGQVARTRTPLVAADASALTAPAWDPSFEQRYAFRTKALLVVPLLARDQRPLAVLELQNPVGPANEALTFGPEQEAVARALAGQAALGLEHALELERTDGDLLESLCSLACLPEHRDADIGFHVRRISGYSRVVARAVGLEPAQARAIELASPLHDIGKIGTPPTILFKPGKLTDDEFRITKEHSALGHELLAAGAARSQVLKLAAEIAVAHHERWDGTGYPHGLAGGAIPLPARIVAIADVFDALTTRRIYKPAIGVEQSLQILGKESGKHFDPDLVDAFQRVFPEILDVKRRFTPDE